MYKKKWFSIFIICIICNFSICYVSYAQSDNNIATNIINQLSLKEYKLNAFKIALMELNISLAFAKSSKGIIGAPVEYDSDSKIFKTTFTVLPNSSLLNSSSKNLIEELEAEVNGICFSMLANIFKNPKCFSELLQSIEADFVTIQAGSIYTIAKFKKGKIILIREKLY